MRMVRMRLRMSIETRGKKKREAFAFDGDVAGETAEEGDLTEDDEKHAAGQEKPARDDEQAAEAAEVEAAVHAPIVGLAGTGPMARCETMRGDRLAEEDVSHGR